MIVLFVGAGASYALEPKKYPTTVEFYDRMDKAIHNDLNDTVDGLFLPFIDEIKSIKGKIDIENVLWRISKSKKIFSDVVDLKEIPGKILSQYYNKDFNRINSWSIQLEDLEDKIYQEVYELYNKSPNNSSIKTWVKLINGLVNKTGMSLEIFTTNYDVVLDYALRSADISSVLPFDNGTYIGPGGDSILDMERFENYDYNSHIGHYAKIHGSVHWQYLDDGIVSVGGSRTFSGNHDRHAIIYPSVKGVPSDVIFGNLYAHLTRCLQKAKVLIFIGYSFRDESLSGMIKVGTDKSSIKIVVDVYDNEKDVMNHPLFPFEDKSFHYVGGGFGNKSLDKIVASLP